MAPLPQRPLSRRAPRARLNEHTPAVVRLQDGRLASGKLLVISATGGLLGVAGPLQQNSVVKIMFVTKDGPILGTAEMLHPINSSLQAFQFASVSPADQKRLGATVRASISRTVDEDDWIQRYRAAAERGHRPKRRFLRWALGALTVGTLCLGMGLYALHAQLLR